MRHHYPAGGNSLEDLVEGAEEVKGKAKSPRISKGHTQLPREDCDRETATLVGPPHTGGSGV